jgi:hypothetical protein
MLYHTEKKTDLPQYRKRHNTVYSWPTIGQNCIMGTQSELVALQHVLDCGNTILNLKLVSLQ